MNALHAHLETGTVGELLVQLRLLQFHVQAAPPLKDSGNDLIAIRGTVFKAIQVKTTTGTDVHPSDPDRIFHLLALVRLEGEDDDLFLDQCDIYLIPKEDIAGIRRASKDQIGALPPFQRVSCRVVCNARVAAPDLNTCDPRHVLGLLTRREAAHARELTPPQGALKKTVSTREDVPSA